MSRVVPDRLSLTSRDGKVDVIETPRRPERRRLPRYRMFESTSLQRRVRANQLIGPRVSPVAVCPVIRPLTDLSQKGFTLLVLTTLASLRRVFEGFTFVRLSDAHLHEIDLALFLQRSPPRLFTAAAWSGLGPAPETRSRGANPHLSRSLSTRWSVHHELLSVCACSTLNPRKSNSPSGTLQMRVFSSFTISFSLPMSSRIQCNASSALPRLHRITR